MKKLFTLAALLAIVLGANAQGGKWEKILEINYSTYAEFPFYVMAYAPTCDGSAMVDAPTTQKLWRGNEQDFPGEEACPETVTINGNTFYVQEMGESQGRQYFIATGIPTKIDGKYKVVAKVKASEPATFNVDMRWNWTESPKSTNISIPEGSEFQEVEWTYEGIGGSSCDLIAQPWAFAGTIEWQSLVVYEWQKDGQRPKVWQEWLTSDGNPVTLPDKSTAIPFPPATVANWMGNAETPWGDLANVKYNDQTQNYLICAWSKERMVNLNDDGGWDPFPATIEEEEGNTSNHVFVCHGKAAITEGDAAAWDNQFWIQSPREWKSGEKVKIHFRYKASKTVEVETQTHYQTPSNYLIWHGIGNITFTEEWKEYDGTTTIADDMTGGWSFAFNLNAKDKEAIDFYFDDISWQSMVLDQGYFVSGINATTTTSYDDLDNAIEFEEEDGLLVATVGKTGEANTYVDQIMISTVRGDDEAFKGATLKPEHKIKNDLEDWQAYTESVNAKLDLPGLGVWKIYIDTEYNAMVFEMLEGTPYEQPDPVAIITNPAVITVNATEREYTAAEAEAAGVEAPAAPGAPWDNQFFIKANRILKEGEVTVVEFDYVATKDAKVTTQGHALPGTYRGGGCGDVNFTTTEAHFVGEFKVPAHQSNDIQSIAFNLSEIKDANDYTFKNFKWYLKDESLDEGMTYENLIDETGTENNFSWKVLTGIIGVINDFTIGSDVIYNLSGQRVTEDYKGVVIKNGRKVVVK